MDKNLNIIICDDEGYILNSLHKRIRQIIKNGKYPVGEIFLAKNAKEVFEIANKNLERCLYFLDIDLGINMVDGIQIAQYIKDKKSVSKVVFVTNFSDKKDEILRKGTEPLGFIEKKSSSMNRKLKTYITLAIKRFGMNHESECIELNIGLNNKRRIPKSDIVYVDTNKARSHGLIYHKFDGQEIHMRDSINNALKLLGESFMFSNRGVIINKQYVVKVEKGEVFFSTGDKCSCSMAKKNEVIKQCLK